MIHQSENTIRSGKLLVPLHVVVSSISLTIFLAAFSPSNIRTTTSWLASFYFKTARFEFGTVICPWAYRFFKPVLCGIMPGDERFNFPTLTYIFLSLGLIGIYLLIREFNMSSQSAYSGMILFAFSYPFRHTLIFPWFLDDVTQCLIIYGVLLVARKNYPLFSLILFLGTLNHEHIFILIPVFFIHILSRFGAKKSVRYLMYLAPALLTFYFVRKYVPVPNLDYLSYYFRRDNIIGCYNQQGGIINMINVGYNTFGFLWLASLFGIARGNLSTIEQSIFLTFPLSAAQLIIGCDTSRLLAVNLVLLILISIRSFSGIHFGWTIFLVASFVMRSLARFSPESVFHPWWLLQIPDILLTLMELSAFLVLMLYYARKKG